MTTMYSAPYKSSGKRLAGDTFERDWPIFVKDESTSIQNLPFGAKPYGQYKIIILLAPKDTVLSNQLFQTIINAADGEKDWFYDEFTFGEKRDIWQRDITTLSSNPNSLSFRALAEGWDDKAYSQLQMEWQQLRQQVEQSIASLKEYLKPDSLDPAENLEWIDRLSEIRPTKALELVKQLSQLCVLGGAKVNKDNASFWMFPASLQSFMRGDLINQTKNRLDFFNLVDELIKSTSVQLNDRERTISTLWKKKRLESLQAAIKTHLNGCRQLIIRVQNSKYLFKDLNELHETVKAVDPSSNRLVLDFNEDSTSSVAAQNLWKMDNFSLSARVGSVESLPDLEWSVDNYRVLACLKTGDKLQLETRDEKKWLAISAGNNQSYTGWALQAAVRTTSSYFSEIQVDQPAIHAFLRELHQKTDKNLQQLKRTLGEKKLSFDQLGYLYQNCWQLNQLIRTSKLDTPFTNFIAGYTVADSYKWLTVLDPLKQYPELASLNDQIMRVLLVDHQESYFAHVTEIIQKHNK